MELGKVPEPDNLCSQTSHWREHSALFTSQSDISGTPGRGTAAAVWNNCNICTHVAGVPVDVGTRFCIKPQVETSLNTDGSWGPSSKPHSKHPTPASSSLLLFIVFCSSSLELNARRPVWKVYARFFTYGHICRCSHSSLDSTGTSSGSPSSLLACTLSCRLSWNNNTVKQDVRTLRWEEQEVSPAGNESSLLLPVARASVGGPGVRAGLLRDVVVRMRVGLLHWGGEAEKNSQNPGWCITLCVSWWRLSVNAAQAFLIPCRIISSVSALLYLTDWLTTN